MAEEAIKQLEKFSKTGERFLLGLGFFKPHLPFVATKKDWLAFEKTNIPLPLSPVKSKNGAHHNSGEFYKYKTTYKESNPLSKEHALKSKRAYLACIRYVDRQVGKVLKAVDDFKLNKNTIVIIWGDHGWHLGEHQMWGKHSTWETANRSVLMMRGPEIKLKGNCSKIIESIDIYPTLIDMCKPKFTKIAHKLDGHNLSKFIKKKTQTTHNYALSYWNGSISIRDKQYRLVHSEKTKKSQLYDLKNDLFNQKDISTIKPEIVKKMIKAIPR
jgi:arylsulfatase A-like enzyme